MRPQDYSLIQQGLVNSEFADFSRFKTRPLRKFNVHKLAMLYFCTAFHDGGSIHWLVLRSRLCPAAFVCEAA